MSSTSKTHIPCLPTTSQVPPVQFSLDSVALNFRPIWWHGPSLKHCGTHKCIWFDSGGPIRTLSGRGKRGTKETLRRNALQDLQRRFSHGTAIHCFVARRRFIVGKIEYRGAIHSTHPSPTGLNIIRGRPQMTSYLISRFWSDPPPRQYQVHATSLLFVRFWLPLPLPDVICASPA